jgi:hypothetical protein
VSNDFGEFFTSLRDDPAGPRLATAATLRAVGDRRTRMRRVVGIGGVAVAVAVVAGTASVAYSGSTQKGSANGGEPNGAGGVASSSPPAFTRPSVSPVPKTSFAKPANNPGRTCGRADLKAHTSGRQWTIIVTIANVSATPCSVRGFPALAFARPDGSPATLPTAHRGPSNPTAVLTRTGNATVTIAIDSGRPDTHVTDCSQPSTYQGISLVLDGAGRIPLPGLGINAQCDTVSITSWSPAAT